jgi:peptidoglycan/LPS O-acetylase OafA/YrhL
MNHAPTEIPESRKRIRLGFLDGIRGLAALYVVFHHFCLGSDAPGIMGPLMIAGFFTQFGHAAVAVFIVLSGFSLMLPVVASGSLRGGATAYMARRAKRILPPYYAALALSICVLIFTRDPKAARELSPGSMVSHLLLFHNIGNDWVGMINMALWSVATEWQIYVLLPLLLIPVWRRWGPWAVLAIGCLVGPIPHAVLHGAYNLDAVRPWMIGLFAMGVATASLASQGLILRLGARGSLAAIWAVILIYAGMRAATWGHNGVYPQICRDYLVGAAAALLIARCVAYPASSIRAILEARACVLLGAFSYSLYLTHCAVLNGWYQMESHVGMGASTALFVRTAAGVPVAVIAAYVFYLAFERPLVRVRASGSPIKPASQARMGPEAGVLAAESVTP